MRAYDPDKFAVGGSVGRPVYIPGKPHARHGKVRIFYHDPEDIPILILTFTLNDLKRAQAEYPDIVEGIRLSWIKDGRKLPAPEFEMQSNDRMPEMVYTLPEVDAIITYLRTLSALKGTRSPALEIAHRTMLEQVSAAKSEFMETYE